MDMEKDIRGMIKLKTELILASARIKHTFMDAKYIPGARKLWLVKEVVDEVFNGITMWHVIIPLIYTDEDTENNDIIRYYDWISDIRGDLGDIVEEDVFDDNIEDLLRYMLDIIVELEYEIIGVK